MIDKISRLIEIIFDVTLGAIRSVLLMIIVAILALTFILTGTIAAVVSIVR